MTNRKIFLKQKNTGETELSRSAQSWRRLPVLLLLVAMAVVLLTATALADSPSSTATSDETAAPAVSTPPPQAIFLSSSSNGEIDDDYNASDKDVHFKDEDILRCVPTGNECTWDIYFDGSDVGLGSADLEDFEILPNGHILFTLDRTLKLTVDGVPNTEVKRFDVLEFIPTSVGPNTSGTFHLFLKGADVGLTKSDEDIDALALSPTGNLVISIKGSGKVPKDGGGELAVKDEDLIELNSAKTAWSFYFDGSPVSLTSGSEDVAAAWIDTLHSNNLYLATHGSFSAHSGNSLSGKNTEVFGCAPTSSIPITSCFFFRFFNAKIEGFKKGIDGLFIAPATSAVAQQVVASAADDEADVNTADEAPDFSDADLNDTELDVHDYMDVQEQVFLPVIVAH